MNIVIDTGDKIRKINSYFLIYGGREDLTLIRDAIDEALRTDVVLGWVQVGEPTEPESKDIFPWEAKGEKRVLKWEE